VFIGWSLRGETGHAKHSFDGGPAEILEQTEAAALQQLLELAQKAQ